MVNLKVLSFHTLITIDTCHYTRPVYRVVRSLLVALSNDGRCQFLRMVLPKLLKVLQLFSKIAIRNDFICIPVAMICSMNIYLLVFCHSVLDN